MVGERFDQAPNALNFLRLCLAIEVIVWHSYSLRGGSWLPSHVAAFLGDIAVDSFFAVSGFLICRAWMRKPHLGRFLIARARRILPGLWVCLLVTAFVVAPVAAWLSRTAQPTMQGQWRYVLGNADTWVHVWGIDGGPHGVPQSGVWDGSLWSLGYEAMCYLAVAVLGLTGLLRPRVVLALAVVCWALSASLTFIGVVASGTPIWVGPRCGLMFACGALLWMWRDFIPVSGVLALISTAALLGGSVLPNYRLLAAPAIAYLCLVIAMWLGRRRRLVLRNDLSYGTYIYAFVVQQALVLTGVRLGWVLFTLVSLSLTLPLAALSWFAVERPAQRRRSSVIRTPIETGQSSLQA